MSSSNYVKPDIKTNFSNIPVFIFIIIAGFLYIFGLYSFYDYIMSPQSQEFFNLIKDNLPDIISVGSQLLPYLLAFLFFFIVISILFSWILLKIISKVGQEVTIVVTILAPLIIVGLGILLLLSGGGITFIGIIFVIVGGLLLLLVIYKFNALKRAGKFVEFSAQLALDEKAVLIAPIILGFFTLISGFFMMFSYWEVNQLVLTYMQNQSQDTANYVGNIVALIFEYFFLIVYLGISYTLNGMVISYAGDWYRGLDPDMKSARKDISAVIPIILKFAFAMATVQMIYRVFARALAGQSGGQVTGSTSGRRGGGGLNGIGIVFTVIGFFLISIIGAIWAFLNYFTLISIIQKKKNLTESIKDSASTMWHGFLDVLVGDTGFGLTMGIFAILYFFLWFGTGLGIGYFALGNDIFIGFVVGILFVVLSTFSYNVISMPMNTSFKTFLYCYAQDYMDGFDKPSKLPLELRDDFKYLQNNYKKRKMKDPSQIL